MQTIIEYLKSTYNASQLAFLAVLGILVALGFLVSFTFACIKTCINLIVKKLSLETEISETYLLYTHLCDQLKELPDGEEKDTEKTKKLELEIAELKQTLKTLLGGKDLSAAKKIADFNLKRQKLKIAKTEERRDESGVAKLVYIPPEANFLDADAAEEVKMIFADADIPFNDESLEYKEKIPPEISARWKITIRNGIYTAELFIGENSVLSSSAYKSLSGVKSAIITIKNNVLSGNATAAFEDGKFLLKVFSASGRVVALGKKRDLSVYVEEEKTILEKYIEAASALEPEII